MSLPPHVSLPQPQGTFVLDLRGIISHWSAGAATLYRWTAREVVGQPLSVLFPGQPALLDELGRVREGRELRTEKRSQRRDGSPFWADVHTTLMLDETGAAVGLLGVVQDAAERRRLAAEVLRQTEMEHHLISMVSHDLRNPLHAVLLSATLGLNSTSDQKLRRYFERIKISASRGAQLIHDLLDFNVVRHGGHLQLHPQPIDFGAVVKDQIDEVLASRPERQVHLQTHGDLDGSWDPGRLAQVASNLISNALQHSTEDVFVTVRVDGGPTDVTLSVHNRGPEVPSDVRAKLFEPRVHGHASGGGGRSIGLGLFIARAIVSAHRGTITCDSSSENGTTFTVRLPRCTPPP